MAAVAEICSLRVLSSVEVILTDTICVCLSVSVSMFIYVCVEDVLNRWRRGVVVSGVGLINEVNRHRARLVLGWVTVCGRVNHLGM